MQLQRLFASEDKYRPVRYAKRGQRVDRGADGEGSPTVVDDIVPIEELPLGELRKLLEHAAHELGQWRQVHQHTGPAGDPIRFEVTLAGGERFPAPVVAVSDGPDAESGS